MSATPATSRSGDTPALHRGLGVGSIVFMVVAAAAPLAVVVATVPLIFSITGTLGAPVFFLLAGVILTAFSVGFVQMSRFVPNAGAFYSYIQTGLGRVPGMGAASLAMVAYTVNLVAVTAYFGFAGANVITHYTGINVPWWIVTLIAFVVIGLLGYRDISLSSKVLGAALVIETLSVVIVDIAIIAAGGQSGLNLVPFAPSEIFSGAPGLGLMFAFFAFVGFEATAVFRNEARNPERTIPRATYIAVISIALLYAFSAWSVAMGAGTESTVESATADPANFVLDLAGAYVSPILQDLMQVLLATSFFACSLSFHNVITRYQFTLGSVGMLPQRLGTVHPKLHAPSFSSLVASIISVVATLIVVLLQLDPVTQIYTWFAGAATLGLVFLMALTCVAVVAYFRRHRVKGRRWQTLIAPILSFIGLAVVFGFVVGNFPLLTGSDLSAIVIGALVALLFIGGVVAAMIIRTRRPDLYEAFDAATGSEKAQDRSNVGG